MYRKRNGSLGFSFTKFAHAAVPNFFNDSLPSTSIGLGPLTKDLLYSHQLASPNFLVLDTHSFCVAGIVDTDRLSRAVHKSLTRATILDADGLVNTHAIGPDFINQVAILDRWRQRELVNLLFWWEEEGHRFRKLGDEDRELGELVEEAERFAGEDREDGVRRERVDQLKFARERVRMKVRQRPSQRREDTENDTDDLMEWFRGRAGSAPVAGGAGAAVGERGVLENTDARRDDVLPDYSLVGVSTR